MLAPHAQCSGLLPGSSRFKQHAPSLDWPSLADSCTPLWLFVLFVHEELPHCGFEAPETKRCATVGGSHSASVEQGLAIHQGAQGLAPCQPTPAIHPRSAHSQQPPEADTDSLASRPVRPIGASMHGFKRLWLLPPLLLSSPLWGFTGPWRRENSTRGLPGSGEPAGAAELNGGDV